MTPNTKYTFTNKTRAIALAGLGFACAAIPARSQDAAPDKVYDLDAFVAVASRVETPINQVGSSVEVLESFDLQKGQNAYILDSIRLVPGFYLRNNGGAGNAFGITTRGLSGNTPLVLVNGIEVSNPNNGQMVNLGNLMSGNVSRVEILKGPQSSLYGANALAGVISVNSPAAGESDGGRLSLGYGSYDTYEYGIGHSGSRDDFSWSIDANVRESEGFSVQDPSFGPEWADTDTYDSVNISSIFRYNENENVSVYLSTYYLDAYAEFDPGDPSSIWGAPYGDNYSKNKEFYAKLGSDFRLADNWTSTASITYADIDYFSHTSSDYYADGDRYKYNLQNTIEANESWTLVAGVEHKKDEIDIDVMDNTSVYMENLFAVNEDFDVTVGFRYDDHNRYGSETTYRSTFSYRIDELDARIRGSYGSSFQAPTFLHLRAPYGKPDISPEFGKGWDLGIEKSFADGRVFASTTLFGNDIEDKIAWGGSNYDNVSEYKSSGLETSLRVQAADNVSITAGHTYSDAEEAGSIEALRVPRNLISLGVFWTAMDDKLGINLSGIKVSSQFSSSADRGAGMKQNGYSVVNLAVQYDISELYSVWARVGNLLDKDYEEISSYQTAGANFNAGVRLKF